MTGDPPIGAIEAPDLHVMTLNVRRRLGGFTWRAADRWSNRRPRVQALVRAARPTLLGVQEALPDQARTIGEALGAGYGHVGYGRNKGRSGEGCPLYYDQNRLELIQSRQTALSDRPLVAGSRSWGNLLPRVLVTATFRDRVTSAVFVVMNTHLDPFSNRSRVRSVREIRRSIRGLGLPVILTGDLNALPGSPAIRALFADGIVRDAWSTAAERITPEWTTYAHYRRPRASGRRIDWIAVTPDIEVTRAAIDAEPVDGGWASDHLPVHAVVRVAPQGGAR